VRVQKTCNMLFEHPKKLDELGIFLTKTSWVKRQKKHTSKVNQGFFPMQCTKYLVYMCIYNMISRVKLIVFKLKCHL
jgi:hypothetical protein